MDSSVQTLAAFLDPWQWVVVLVCVAVIIAALVLRKKQAD